MSEPIEANKAPDNGEIANITPAEVLPVTPEPVKVPESQPVIVESPPAPPLTPRFNLNPLACPECGWIADNERAKGAHIRFKHELPRRRKEAAERKLKQASDAGRASAIGLSDSLPAPDFSDIDASKTPPAPSLVPSTARYEAMAAMTFDMSTAMLARIFGPEWQAQPDADNPKVSTERATVVLALQKYYESIQLPDMPPGYVLCFVCLAYAAPRLNASPTKTKLQQIWLWIKSKFSRAKKL